MVDLLKNLIEAPVVPVDDLRAILAKFSTPALDEFRLSVRALLTSGLIMLLTSPDQLAIVFDLSEADADNEVAHKTIMAAQMAVADEIDRRFPSQK